MFDKRSETTIFSFGEQPVAASTLSNIEPFYPFADAWKEFDKLEKAVQGGGRLSVVRRVIEGLSVLLGLGSIQFHPFKGGKQMIAVAFFTILIAEFFHGFTVRRRFQHWPCPRCHSEWPGDKKEKDRACKVCGLRLHQLSP